MLVMKIYSYDSIAWMAADFSDLSHLRLWVDIAAWAADGVAQQLDWAGSEEKLKAPQITRSDQQFLDQNLEFVWGCQGLNLTELNDLFEKVGAHQSTPSPVMIGEDWSYLSE